MSLNTVPFGLAQAPAYFQQLISMVLQDCRDFVMAYLDDIIIFSRTPEEHLKHIEIIFQKLKIAGLKLKESKCDFFKSEIHYLGHLISDKGIQPLPEKLDTIRNMPRPRTPKEIKQFLGLTGYYRKFVPHFSEISRPLAKLTAKDASFEWTPQCQFSFEMLKDALMFCTYSQVSQYGEALYNFYRCKQIWVGWCTHSRTHICHQWKRSDNESPCGICQWNVSW